MNPIVGISRFYWVYDPKKDPLSGRSDGVMGPSEPIRTR